MIQSFSGRRTGYRWKCRVGAVISLLIMVLLTFSTAQAMNREPLQKKFVSPEEAVRALVEAIKLDNPETLKAVLGPGSENLISSGDEIADKSDQENFIDAYEEKNRIEIVGVKRAVLRVGNKDWPMPISIVKKGKHWLFDAKAAEDEILNRRIGRNELSAMQVCLAYVDAQREYAQSDMDDDGLLEYAQKFESDSGLKNGLYWETKENEPRSPFGLFICMAAKEGYEVRGSLDAPEPYHGYFYKILKSQGKSAPGGAFDYVVNGKMIGGFAMVAYPARYGVSGVMTFIVNQDGDIYEKNLGKNTMEIAEAMTVFNPNKTWRKVVPKELD